MRVYLSAVFITVFFLTACARQVSTDVQNTVDATTGLGAAETKFQVVDPQLAKIKCQNLCRVAIAKGVDLSAWPCLGNPMAGMDGWVCDVAHNPRQAVDNKPENQCSAFRSGQAKHFVEVDENCSIIRAY